jgi:hypothetical protein
MHEALDSIPRAKKEKKKERKRWEKRKRNF